MKIDFGDTARGFSKGMFRDRYGADCSIQMSSLATERAIWLGTDGPDGDRMHLTRDMVAALMPVLSGFIKTGELRDPAVSEGVEGRPMTVILTELLSQIAGHPDAEIKVPQPLMERICEEFLALVGPA